MASFKNFLQFTKSENKALSKNNDSKLAIANTISDVLSKNMVATKAINMVATKAISPNGLFSTSNKKEIAAEEFSKNVSELVHSDEFLEEFSENIGTPKENESEDEFVNRAKDIMRTLLKKKLSNH